MLAILPTYLPAAAKSLPGVVDFLTTPRPGCRLPLQPTAAYFGFVGWPLAYLAAYYAVVLTLSLLAVLVAGRKGRR